MKLINKVMIELTSEEYESLIIAQSIMKQIGDELDNENVLSKELETYFDSYNNSLENIVGIIENGIEKV